MREQDLDLTGWLEFFVAGLSTQVDEVKRRGEQVIRRDVLAHRHRLNDRQSRVVDALATLDWSSIDDVQAALPEFPRRTLQRDLQILVEKRIAVADGAARARRYHLQDGGA